MLPLLAVRNRTAAMGMAPGMGATGLCFNSKSSCLAQWY